MKMKAKNNKLKCPNCGFERLIDANDTNVSELIPEYDFKFGMHYDYKQKCGCCKTQIYISKVS